MEIDEGYTYSIYAFQHETKAETFHEFYGHKIRPGSLISLIQRGLQYRELELQINKARSRNAASPLYQLEANKLIDELPRIQDGTRKELTEDIEPFFPAIPPQTKQIPGAGAGNGNADVDEEEDDEQASVATATLNHAPSTANSRKHGRGEEGVNGVLSGGEKSGVPDKKKRRKTAAPPTPAASTAAERPDGIEGDKAMIDRAPGPSPPIEEIRPITNGCSIGIQVETVSEIDASETLVLPGDHKVNTVAWSPVESGKLATGPQTSFGKIWSIPDGLELGTTPKHISLDHTSALVKSQQVTAIQWSSEGTIVATGTFDGSIKLWTSAGSIIGTLSLKCCPIMTLKWNKSSTILLSLYIDGGLLAWDVRTCELLQSYEKKLEVLDMVWLGEEAFAAAAEGKIVVYTAASGEVISKFEGEESVGLPCLAWDDLGNRLASGDTKGRIAIWGRSRTSPDHVVQAHGSALSQLVWQPRQLKHSTYSTTPEQNSQVSRRILASSSGQDTTVRLWVYDIALADSAPLTLFHELSLHDSSIIKISFSPDGRYLASGFYKKLYVWRAEDAFLAYVYDASKEQDVAMLNGEVNGTGDSKPVKQSNGDVEMGGMNDHDVDGDTDSGTGGLDTFDFLDLSWEKRGNMVAIAMGGIGCILVPIKPKSPTPRQISPALPAVSDNGSTAETAFSGATIETYITEPILPNGTQVGDHPNINGNIEKPAVR
ncbi:WD40-repeat-containing domain protein [Kalaharituber pfeilii]|nr:WD40-repeat-containing domain protein [Kalaharituber pfeilii]